MALVKPYDQSTKLTYENKQNNQVTIHINKADKRREVTAVIFADEAISKIAKANVKNR